MSDQLLGLNFNWNFKECYSFFDDSIKYSWKIISSIMSDINWVFL